MLFLSIVGSVSAKTFKWQEVKKHGQKPKEKPSGDSPELKKREKRFTVSDQAGKTSREKTLKETSTRKGTRTR